MFSHDKKPSQDYYLVRPIEQEVYPSRIFRAAADDPIVLASVGICIALLVLTPQKQSATWVFTNVTDGSGWGSRGFSFLLGLVVSML